ncbi:MAG TPA: response regulator transcription factor [Chloroflexota bacterium]|nr:response regulator transcription factor [Chloroflexota bacterium]HEX2987064.1 response regulator transcription factor [Chloroflexota bacterium]
MAKILVVDDEPVMLSTVRRVLLDAEFLVDTATEGESALTMAREGSYDLIILDVRLPDIDGLTVCQTLRQESSIPILMLTVLGDCNDKVGGLEAGADDYLTKPFNSRELVARVIALLRRSAFSAEPTTQLQSGCLQTAGLEIDLVRRQVTRRGQYLRLTPKEFDLLVFLATHPGRAFAQGKLLEEVWRFDNPSDTRTVQVHIRWLRQKLEDDPSLPRLIETVRGKGYRFVC